MAHRIAHLADKAHLDSHTLERINSAVIFGLIGGGLFACVLGALVYDVSRAVSVTGRAAAACFFGCRRRLKNNSFIANRKRCATGH